MVENETVDTDVGDDDMTSAELRSEIIKNLRSMMNDQLGTHPTVRLEAAQTLLKMVDGL